MKTLSVLSKPQTSKTDSKSTISRKKVRRSSGAFIASVRTIKGHFGHLLTSRDGLGYSETANPTLTGYPQILM